MVKLFGKRRGWKWKVWLCDKKSQIEKRNNQVVVEIKTLHVSSVDNTSWKLLEKESWWNVFQNLQTHFDELLLLLCFDTMVH